MFTTGQFRNPLRTLQGIYDLMSPCRLKGSPSLEFCDEKLKQTSRSFDFVIRLLPEKLHADVNVFYLVLRALDTVEDDMSYPHTPKIEALKTFSSYLKRTRSGGPPVVGNGAERELLENFHHVVNVYSSLPPASQSVIVDITDRMAEGMQKLLTLEGVGQINTFDDYDEYTYYVAGLVGEGLTRLWLELGHEDSELLRQDNMRLSVRMGKFLQRTNIIRDVREDLLEGRVWWPKDLVPHLDVNGHGQDADAQANMAKLNAMVDEALSVFPDCQTYLAELKTPGIFRFCAIPQAMAFATLCKLRNNPDVFQTRVKLSKWETLKIMASVRDIESFNACIELSRASTK